MLVRFYLNAPLVIGYVSMALVATLGVLQFAAAQGRYQGLSLFVDMATPSSRKRGAYIGLGLTVSALLLYVLFAPEILTPGPAGTEVTEMFTLCTLLSLGVTLTGAHIRLKQRQQRQSKHTGIPADTQALQATFHPPASNAPNPPSVILLPDPTGFITAPETLIHQLCQTGLAVLALKPEQNHKRLHHLNLLSTLSAAVNHLARSESGKIGLLGLGLGGDAVLRAASVDPRVAAVLAVNPVLNKAKHIHGLDLLCELSYLQSWRWQRHKARQQVAAKLDAPGALQGAFPGAAGLFHSSADRCPQATNAEQIYLQSERYFGVLHEQSALDTAVNWLQAKLLTPTERENTHVA